MHVNIISLRRYSISIHLNSGAIIGEDYILYL